MAFFFFAAVVLHPTANHLSFFILLTWILFYFFQKQEKKIEHLCLLPICCTSARFDAGLQSSVSNPRTPFIFLLKCLLLYPMLMPLRVIFFSLSLFFFFNFHYFYKECCDFNISVLLSTAISNLLVCCLVKHLLMRSSSLKSQLLENNREEVKSIILCYILCSLFSFLKKRYLCYPQ